MLRKHQLMVAVSSTIAFVVAGCSNVATFQVQLPTLVPLAEFNQRYTESSPIEINFWTGFGAAVSTSIEDGITQFQSIYPNIKVTHTSKGGYDNLLKAINLSVTSRTYPDLAVGYPDHFANYIRSSIQLALDPLIASSEYGMDINDFVSDYMGENRSFQFDEQGNPYTLGLPFNKSTEVMVANQTFFNFMASLDATIVVPQTWDQVRAAGEKILQRMASTVDVDGEAGVYGKQVVFSSSLNEYRVIKSGATAPVGFGLVLDFSAVINTEFYPFSYDSMANFFITAVRQWGGTYTEMGENITRGYIRFNTPEIAAMLQYFKDLHEDKILAIPITFGQPQYNSIPFRGNKSVLTISSSAGVFNNVPSAGAFEVTIHPVPYQNASRKYVISQGTNMALFTNRNADRVLASWLFMRYMTTNPGNTQFSVSAGYYPATESGLASAFYQGYLGATEVNSNDKSKIDSAKVNANFYGQASQNWIKFVDPGFVGSSDIREQLDTAFPILLYGRDGTVLTAQEVLDYLQSNLTRYVEAV
jgi:multiple sugar transport system substrate-binding protein